MSEPFPGLLGAAGAALVGGALDVAAVVGGTTADDGTLGAVLGAVLGVVAGDGSFEREAASAATATSPNTNPSSDTMTSATPLGVSAVRLVG